MMGKFQLLILWRHEGENSLSSNSFKAAKRHMNMLEIESGHMIVKMGIIQET